MSTSPGTVEAQLALAIGQVNAGQVESALRICEAAAIAHAPNPAVLQLLAVLLLQKADVARARECIDASLALRPGHGPSLLVAGDAARAAGDLAAALAHHRRAVELMPDRADAAYALARTLREADLPADAEAAFLRTLALAPTHAQSWFALALVRQDRRDLAGAESALRRLLEIAPPRAEVEVNLGIVLQEAGQIDDAMRAYGRAYRLREDSFGRIAHALATPNVGRVWLDLDALRDALRRQPP
jgi:tetratricopeptide (TPR) repeat protein